MEVLLKVPVNLVADVISRLLEMHCHTSPNLI